MSFQIGQEEEKQQQIVPSQTSMEDEVHQFKKQIQKSDDKVLNNLLHVLISNSNIVV
jgi:hypothetical protein